MEVSKMKPAFACVLRLGGEYQPFHVQMLAAQVKEYTTVDYEFICYTDFSLPIHGVRSIPLVNDWPGWWAVPEVFRSVGPTVVVGIDTVIRGNIDELFQIAESSVKKDFWMIRAFRPPVRTISGIMVWNGDWSWLYEEFKYERESSRLRGEEEYTNIQLKHRGIQPNCLQDVFPGIYSYKRHCIGKGIPEDCKVLVFHGKPRPHEVPEIWEPIKRRYL
jgi:hypothetical protein